MTADLRAAIYAGLAEALAVDTRWPDWLCRRGREWPLWQPVVTLAAREERPLLRQAITSLADASATSPSRRRAAFAAVINAHDRPLALHESHFVNGRLLGPKTAAVSAIYSQCGVELAGGELPDHAAVELEFLAFLSEQEAVDSAHARVWQRVQKLFLERHAGRWLPDVGRRLAQADDPGWTGIGLLLTGMVSGSVEQRSPARFQAGLPRITEAGQCSLCGFCSQVCPTRALGIQEDDQATRLYLRPEACIRCRQCVRVCPTRALALTAPATDSSPTMLRQSKRATCPGCGAATISEAELSTVAAQLGHPRWLNYCLKCRGNFYQI